MWTGLYQCIFLLLTTISIAKGQGRIYNYSYEIEGGGRGGGMEGGTVLSTGRGGGGASPAELNPHVC